MKKYLLIALFSLYSIFAYSQAVGDWKMHSVYGDVIGNIFDTKDNVYFISNYNVYCYDKVNDETIGFSKKTKLSDVKAIEIYYDYDKEFLVIVYDNGNIDVMQKNGKVVNIPDLKNIVLSTTKNINYISFVDDKFYVATDFGYMVIGTDKFEVKESHNYGVKIKAATESNGYVILCTESDILTSKTSDNHFSMDSFKSVLSGQISKLAYTIDNKSFILDTGWLYRATVNDDGSVALNVLSQMGSKTIQKRSDDGIFINCVDGNFYIIGNDGLLKEKVDVPTEINKSKYASYGVDGSYWGIETKGVHQVKLESGTVTVMTDYFRPNASSVWYPYYLVYEPRLGTLFVSNVGSVVYKESYHDAAALSTYDGNYWKDVTIYDNVPTPNLKDGVLRSPYTPVYDPEDASVMYLGAWYEGLYRIKDGKITHNYNYDNAPYYKYLNWNCLVPSVAFDKDKNLWTINAFNNEEIFVLPRAKQGVDNTSKADWVSVPLLSFFPEKTAGLLITKKGMKIFHEGKYGEKLFFLDDNGTLDGNDDKTQYFSSLTDQDEKSYTWNYIHCLVEDQNGKVWMGTTNGVVEFAPEKGVNSNFRINRIKVPRNDGTNYADYLLENQDVLAIAVDGANRKWLGTKESGLFLVSSDGSEIIEHFTTDNSYLPSNQVISLCCNPNNNSVYVGTNQGMTEYLSDAYPSEDTYDDVYAYPNPVRPDFTGYITVKGLMDNSLVKIADAAGNVIYSGMSIGGMFTWDGNNSDGSRVKTGVYYVLASQKGNDKSSGVVTKILIIN